MKIGIFAMKSIPRGIQTKFPGERGIKICQIPRGIGDGDPRGGNPRYNIALSTLIF